ncbi:uncharacterized protein LOC111712820 [Eurytemora carolleeae]|uniref:uncharacterized protein LOC111712820 n=1 Tax=Eurytemora carolleeae TaxID=1294199 RepID=UPI000C77B754|nr:uncharacterized protein LOC111712820 [Eurytemora carolleeae]|eukprot:XP_023343322.1 uncharacterized protein LOC111712820 [Eurytemora affinis]
MRKIIFLCFQAIMQIHCDSVSPKEKSVLPPTSSSSFPSISSNLNSDGFSLPTRQADLEQTDLARNSPMGFSLPTVSFNLEESTLSRNSPMQFSIPQLELKLGETELSRSSPMLFSIITPEQDLKPSFLDKVEADNKIYEENLDQEEVGPLYASEPVNVVYEENVEEEVVLDATEPEPVLTQQDKAEDYKPNQPVKVDESGKLPLEPTRFNQGQTRFRRQAPSSSSSFPSFYSSFQSSSPFSISFPTPDLTPGKIYNFAGFGPSHTAQGFQPGSLDDQLVAGRPVNRPVRQFKPADNRPPPRYPPLDPFHTVEYIPLPGPSNPAFALPLDTDDPHMHPGYRNVKFRRPIRQVDLPAFLARLRPASFNNFRFQPSPEFRGSKVQQFLKNRQQKLHYKIEDLRV